MGKFATLPVDRKPWIFKLPRNQVIFSYPKQRQKKKSAFRLTPCNYTDKPWEASHHGPTCVIGNWTTWQLNVYLSYQWRVYLIFQNFPPLDVTKSWMIVDGVDVTFVSDPQRDNVGNSSLIRWRMGLPKRNVDNACIRTSRAGAAELEVCEQTLDIGRLDGDGNYCSCVHCEVFSD